MVQDIEKTLKIRSICKKVFHSKHEDIRIYFIASDIPMSFITLDKKIFISTTLLNQESPYYCSNNELAAILAHEISHFERSHFLKQVNNLSIKYSVNIEFNQQFKIIDFENAPFYLAPMAIKLIKPEYYEDHKESLWDAVEANALQNNFSNDSDQDYTLFYAPQDIISILSYGFSLEDEIQADKDALDLLKSNRISSESLSAVLEKHLHFLKSHQYHFSKKEYEKYLSNFTKRIKKIKEFK